MRYLSLAALTLAAAPLLSGCASKAESLQAPRHDFLMGADLSYVNEMLDCGADFPVTASADNPYALFAQAGTDLVRVRLWHSPEWTGYSDFDDVRATISRSHAEGMKVLLDLHYSDTWANPHKQIIPAAWEHLYDDRRALAQAVYDYTYNTLKTLHQDGLLPEYVQVGNETNIEILKPEEQQDEAAPINWPRNVELLNQGLQAVADINRELGVQVQTMIHIAQPENALEWFPQALDNGLESFDLVGLSYYPKWSEYRIDQLGQALTDLEAATGRAVMIVETAYPWTLENFDDANNILGEDSLISGFDATPEGQYRYFDTLAREVKAADGVGLIYWEPAWVSNDCHTLWGHGSHWENASFFDANNNNQPLPVFDVYERY